MLAALLAVLAAATPEAAPAATTQAPAAAATAPAPAPAPTKNKDQLICKSEQVTGSRFSKKVCYSKAEYEEKQRLDQEHLRESQAGGLQRQ